LSDFCVRAFGLFTGAGGMWNESTVPTTHWHRLDDARGQCDICPRSPNAIRLTASSPAPVVVPSCPRSARAWVPMRPRQVTTAA